LSACSENAFVKKSSLMERIKTAERGNKNNASIKKLGRIKNQITCEELIDFFMIQKVAQSSHPATRIFCLLYGTKAPFL
jgi:hypothetical protein